MQNQNNAILRNRPRLGQTKTAGARQTAYKIEWVGISNGPRDCVSAIAETHNARPGGNYSHSTIYR